MKREIGANGAKFGRRRGSAALPLFAILCFISLFCLLAPPGCDAQFTNLWKFHLPGRWSDAAPAIARDGTLYQPTFNGTLVAIGPDGSTNWEFKAGLEIASSPAIGSDGTIYFGSRDRKFYAVTPGGVMSAQWLPWSRVLHTLPSSVPTQIVSTVLCDGATA